MFQVTMCPSSREITVSMRHWYLSQSDKYQVSHRYSYFSWWWAHSHPKHVEKRNKHTKKNRKPGWLYLQDYIRLVRQSKFKQCITSTTTQLSYIETSPSESILSLTKQLCDAGSWASLFSHNCPSRLHNWMPFWVTRMQFKSFQYLSPRCMLILPHICS